ncbi:SNF2 family N-terminal domain-containing protein [Crepidotus variabilis]|uniref:DNA helicase n=1 Tax=Crepidotus variabilis TaxID=179855 RepID=A0A9P6EI66_9AGAR|nr:SNF2 family N-terminal domain-containing protein [Crepidotus variabilis]
MISAMDSSAENKRLALDKLRSNRNTFASRDQPGASSSTMLQHQTTQPNYPVPPSQSRDASGPSRFFPTSPPPLGNVLVPNSSPIPQDHPYGSNYRPHNPLAGHNVAPSSSFSFGGGWGQSRLGAGFDPLSAPSGFITHGASSNASQRRRTNGDVDSEHHDGPPRKKINRGPSNDVFVVPESPPSPEIHRPGQRRQVSAIGLDAMSLSSDESMQGSPGNLSGPSKSRLTKDRPMPSSDSNSVAESPPDRQFLSFKMTHPTESFPRIQAAWKQAAGDEKKATAFLLDSAWSPAPTAPTTPATPKEVSSRVKEIDEATKAQRAAEREKGKKSMIYANRIVLDTQILVPSTPSPSKASMSHTSPPSMTLDSPLTPALKAPSRKRAKKLVIDSDDEGDAHESDEEVEVIEVKRERLENINERRALDYLNTSNADALQELTGCTTDQANLIISLRPFASGDDIRDKLNQGKKKAGPNGISPRMFDECAAMFKEYGSVDNVLEDCERIGADLRSTIASWSPNQDADDGAVALLSLGSVKDKKHYLATQPKLLSTTVTLKEYQLLGVNWLNLLYRSSLSCILADEMGLGKTIQVIGFLAYLREIGKKGPHLIVVPSSTLENWCREFARFAPEVKVQTYYGDKNERPELRQKLLDTQRSHSIPDGWEVLITTYNLAQGDDKDRKFFRRMDWDCCVYDEGHVLKNFQSQRYQSLLKFPYKWRLLLTGTPLQNNLQELVSLLNFILPDQFADSLESLRAIFKVRGDAKVSLLSQERISRAKKMMTPFVLRRRKDQVLKDLPNKSERIEWCDLSDLQRSIYRATLQRSRKVVLEALSEDGKEPTKAAKKTRAATKTKDKQYSENSSNVLMDLRKAASHPMLFRTLYTDDALTGITKQLLKEPDFKKRGALFDLVKEDMSVMTDAELQVFCASYKSTRKYLQNDSCYVDAGKVKVLLDLLTRYGKEDRKVLIFSQFTQILDILQAILNHRRIKFLVLTGSTPVDIRQTLVDEFTEDNSVSVFLLSTKAGGMGINLTAASVVIMFDQDFNPHNDRQAQDRAYRIGQKRDVEVVKLISKGTIEEDMLRLGETKLALDEAVAGDAEEKGGDNAPERAMKTSLMRVLRQQFEKEENGSEKRTTITDSVTDSGPSEDPPKKSSS